MKTANYVCCSRLMCKRLLKQLSRLHACFCGLHSFCIELIHVAPGQSCLYSLQVSWIIRWNSATRSRCKPSQLWRICKPSCCFSLISRRPAATVSSSKSRCITTSSPCSAISLCWSSPTRQIWYGGLLYDAIIRAGVDRSDVSLYVHRKNGKRWILKTAS